MTPSDSTNKRPRRYVPVPDGPPNLCACGCGLPVTWNTWRGRWAKWRYGHHLHLSGIEYIVNSESGCWEWQRQITPDGYGVAWDDERKKQRLAHILFYERKYGPVPVGLELDHAVCQNRRCCNPDHLEAVTDEVNTRRGKSAKLTMEIAREIRASSEVSTPLALKYGVSRTTINYIRRGKTWKE